MYLKEKLDNWNKSIDDNESLKIWNEKNIVKLDIDNLLKIINKDSEKELDFIDDIREWLEEQESINWRNKEDIIKIFRRIFTSFAMPWIISKQWNVVRKATLDFQSILFLINKYFLKWEKSRIFFQKNSNKRYMWYTNFWLWIWEWMGIEWYEDEWLKSFFSNSTVTFNQWKSKWYSVSYMIYKLINEFWLIEEWEKDQVKRFIDFINLSTTKKYEVYWKNEWLYEQSNTTVFWLAPLLHSEKLFNYFKDDKSWFEKLSSKEINELELYTAHSKRTFNVEKSLSTYEEYSNRNNTVRYNNQKLDFIVDMWWQIVNSLELAASKNKWLIKVHPTGDIMLFNPKWFSWKMDFLHSWNNKVVFIKTTDMNYYNKMEQLVSLLTWYTAKYNLLKFIWYEWDLLDTYKPKVSAEIRKRRKEAEKIIKAKTKKREKRKTNHINNYLNQSLIFEELKKWQIINWKILWKRKNGRMPVNIKLDNYDIDVYTTSKRLKCSWHTNDQIFKPKEDASDLIHTFVITKLDENRIVLKQI